MHKTRTLTNSVRAIAIAFVIASGIAVAAPQASAAEKADFRRDVRPILSDKCFPCHGPDDKKRKADLRLDLATPPKAEGLLTAGKPEESELYLRISSSDDDERMPPPKAGKPLSTRELGVIRDWIAQGASWSAHWAYVAPARAEPPAVRNQDWPANGIDRFLLARWDREGVRPSPEADRATLLRRLSFDLRGLPPTSADAESFAQDRSPDAWEKRIDQFLASEAYGERMATFWLDLVRFADTVGYHGDQEHHITPYRDYVIDAFINDMPFDQFTREQLAGDLLPAPTSDPDRATDQKIATGYNRLLQTSHEGGVQEKEYLAMYAADRVRNVSAVWMGATVGCAQCHSHKFDPYTIKDFYALAAFFADIDEVQHLRKGSDSTPTARKPEISVLTKRERDRLASAKTDAEREAIKKTARLTMVTVAVEPRTTRVLPRGNWLDESGPIVEPAIPEFYGKLDVGGRRANRLDLARWLTNPDPDPKRGSGLLTARVMVNRLWALMFGAGLCRSLEDLGGQGEAPDHPELLDRLAWEFVESGWSVKHMMKRMAMSRAYRQSSIVPDSAKERDPDNRGFARQARYRLPAEMVRDNALAISGLLVHEIGGPSVRPYQPPGYYRYLNFPKRDYKPDRDARQWRRGVYVHWQRQYLHPMFKAFDAPRREECAASRPKSNTPQAALTLLNDPEFVEAARAFAVRILREGGADQDIDGRLRWAFRQATSRPADAEEIAILKQLVVESRATYARDPKQAQALLAVGSAPIPNDGDPVDLAAWTIAARALLNLHETFSRN